jgi:uncharacterized membrane protein YbhN (UPF0104 family)
MPFFAKLKQKIHIFILLIVLCTMGSVIYNHLDELKQLPKLSIELYFFASLSLLLILFSNGYIYDSLTPIPSCKLSFKDSWHLAMGTSFGNLFGPPKSGLALRAFILKKKGFPYPSYIALTLVVLILATAIQVSLASLSFCFMKAIPQELLKVFYLCIALSSLCFMTLCLHRHIKKIKLKKFPFSQEISQAFSDIISRKRPLLKAISFTIFNTLVGALFFYILLDFFNATLPFTHCLLIFSLSGLLTALAITPGAIGFFEAPALFFSHVFHIPQSSMIACLIIYRIFELGLSLFFGGFSCTKFYRQGFNIMKKSVPDKKEIPHQALD